MFKSMTIINVVLPIFAIIVCGYIAGYTGIVPKAGAKTLNNYVFYIALPALLFQATATAPIAQEDGQLDVMFYPQLQREAIDRFSPENQERLLSGHAVQDNYERASGETISAFLQLDMGTKQVMIVPTEVIGRNLDLLQREYKLSNAELSCLRNGEPLTVIDSDEEMTMGIDLKSRTGIRFCMGDTQKWQQQENRQWEKYNFGLYGCWHTDDDGNLNYTQEEDYSEEMWNELKKKGQRQQEQHARMTR